jgi:hypothetical protein
MSKRLLEVNLSALSSSAQRPGGSERTCLMSGVPVRRMLSTKRPRKFQLVRKMTNSFSGAATDISLQLTSFWRPVQMNTPRS